MKFKKQLILLLILSSNLNGQILFNELLKCNLLNMDVAKHCNVEEELSIYDALIENKSFYAPQPSLESWIERGFDYYSNINPLHRIVLDTIKDLDIKTICEVGAGSGKISKYVYFENPHLELTCVEHTPEHIEQMKENFTTRTHVISPHSSVNATIIQDSFPHLAKLESNSFDLVFTHKIMMHLPFIPAVKSAKELVRVSKKYVLHVENKNQGNEWYSMTIIKPTAMSHANVVGIDYVKLYESLGLKTIRYFETKDPESPATYIVYLGEKVTQ